MARRGARLVLAVPTGWFKIYSDLEIVKSIFFPTDLKKSMQHYWYAQILRSC